MGTELVCPTPPGFCGPVYAEGRETAEPERSVPARSFRTRQNREHGGPGPKHGTHGRGALVLRRRQEARAFGVLCFSLIGHTLVFTSTALLSSLLHGAS